jgi:hypothetical protein
VHPEICEDETLAEVSAYADRTFVRIWTHMDDEGRVVDDARLLKAKLYPLHDSMTAERVEKDLCELAQAGLLQRYVVDGKRYLQAKPKAWARWQNPRRRVASKLPPPPPPDNVGTEPDNVRTCTAGEVGVDGEGDVDGVTPNNRFTRGLAPNVHPQAVDKHLHLVERANGIANGVHG